MTLENSSLIEDVIFFNCMLSFFISTAIAPWPGALNMSEFEINSVIYLSNPNLSIPAAAKTRPSYSPLSIFFILVSTFPLISITFNFGLSFNN